jgi:RNA polymerase sigma factor (sigma-70 family)
LEKRTLAAILAGRIGWSKGFWETSLTTGQRLMESETITSDRGIHTGDFSSLIERVRSGSQDAAWELVEKYGRDVQRFVRRSLHQKMRAKFDSMDFVQIVWGSFFRAPERLQGMEKAEQLIAYLATLAKFKVLTEVRRRMQSEKYNVGREAGVDEPYQFPDQNLAPTPTPSAVAIAKERWEQLMAGQTERVKQIVELRLQGTTFNEIADHLHIHERTARKTIERLLKIAS